jgi:hypothetical protein
MDQTFRGLPQILGYRRLSWLGQIRDFVEKISFDSAEARKLEFQKILWAGKFLKFLAQTFRDAWVAQGGTDHLMRRFQWSRLCHGSVLEQLHESAVSHND